MKQRTVAFLLSVCLLAASAACSGPGAAQTGYSPFEIAAQIAGDQADLAELHTLTLGEEAFSTYLAAYYTVEQDTLQDGAVLYAGGTDASEIAVFALQDAGDADMLEDALLQYIQHRIGDFFGYMPDQVAMLEQAVVTSSGGYVAMLICSDAEQAQASFALCFSQDAAQGTTPAARSVSVQATAGEVSDYDADAVLEAWSTGEYARLSDKNRAILEACVQVIDEVVEEGMSDYEKELAIHDWIIRWADYDAESKNHAPDASPDPDNDNPYGLLIGRRAICTGYTTAFQLFMDLLEIECITVPGTSRSGEREHMWNMVRLDGEWYCVDVTWNDPLSLKEYDAAVQHRYFNVTSEFMRDSDHQWDDRAVPEATATVYRWVAPRDI